MSLFFKRGSSNRAQGFTLIELLVVVAIIGILSSIVLASLNSARQKGRDARRVSDIKQLQLALELSYDANATYPLAVNIASLVTPGFISVIPTDPGAGTPAYGYAPLQSDGATACTATPCPSYVLRAVLETESNSALTSDIDANPIGGLDCTDAVAPFAYCAKP